MRLQESGKFDESPEKEDILDATERDAEVINGIQSDASNSSESEEESCDLFEQTIDFTGSDATNAS